MTGRIQERSWEGFYNRLFCETSPREVEVRDPNFDKQLLLFNKKPKGSFPYGYCYPQICHSGQNMGERELKQNPSLLSVFSQAEQIHILDHCRSLFEGPIFYRKEDQVKVLLWFKRVKESLGNPFFDFFCSTALTVATFDNMGIWTGFVTQEEVLTTSEVFISAMQKLVELSEEPQSILPLLEKYHAKMLTPQELCRNLEDLKEKRDRKRFHERECVELFEGFEQVACPLSEETCVLIFEQYLSMKKFREEIKKQGWLDWIDAAEKIRKRSEAGTEAPEDLLRLLAIAREAMRDHFGIYPYNTQILAVLGLLSNDPEEKGTIAQVHTGEGKSTLVTLLAFVHACIGKVVDVVSSSRSLAQRDAEKYAPFFKEFGITASSICRDDPSDQDFRGQILYGTNHDFEFALMRDQLRAKPQRVIRQGRKMIPRPFEVAIVDEVDNLLMDTVLNAARIGVPAIRKTEWIYRPILAFVEKHKWTPESPESSLWKLRGMLTELQKGLYREEVAAFTDEELMEWMKNASLALYSLKENQDYIVQDVFSSTSKLVVKKKITIVDWKNTGRLQENSRWQGGLHQFLEVKHELNVEDDGLTVASLCHPVYLNRYQKIYGLTGTFGEQVEREEVQSLYRVRSFDVPPHRKNLRQTLPPLFASSKEGHEAAIFKEAEEMQRNRRPVLILCETIQKTVELWKVFRRSSVFVQLLNALQVENEACAIDRAGKPGCVTIATNIAGRGTDILLSRESQAHGGLHVILTFFPENDRIESQAFGRCARQGQMGSSRFILHTEKSLSQLFQERAEAVKESSFKRLERIEVERLRDRYLVLFWKELRAFYHRLSKPLTQEMVKGWLGRIKKEERILVRDLNCLETLVQAAQEGKGFEPSVQGQLGQLAQQYWAHFFYDRLSDLEDEIEMEALYRKASPIWTVIFEIEEGGGPSPS